jgi:hypothetical protein
MFYTKTKYIIFLLLCFLALRTAAQEADRSPFIGFFGGLSSYQGDLQPNSFSFSQSGQWGSIWVRKPITGNISIKGGIGFGRIKAADAQNREYLQIRNLSFYSSVKEAFIELELDVMSLDNNRFSPFASGGLALFHFNPYTFDVAGNKTYLQPLNTEGQGLDEYPERKPYQLYQPAITFGGGLRYSISRNTLVRVQANMRKTFTDYIDDVSSSYPDQNVLLAARGPKAVELAYRGDELPTGSGYPKEGEQRGTPTEMDWYYFAGLSVEIKLNAVGQLFANLRPGRNDWYNKRCPKVIL